jgi:hypothetical protein
MRCDVLSKGFNRGTRTYYFNYSSAIADFIAISLFKAESRAAVIIHTRLHVAAAGNFCDASQHSTERFQIPLLQSRQLLASWSAVNYLA